MMIGGATARVPAKINLHLGVGPLRDDGFHELSTLFCALGMHDDVTVRPAEELTVTVTGENRRAVPSDASNLAARAVVALADRIGGRPTSRSPSTSTSPSRAAWRVDRRTRPVH